MPLDIHHHSRPFDAISWVEKKYRLSHSHASVIADLNGFSRHAIIDFVGGETTALSRIYAPDYQAATPKKGAAA